MKKSLLLTLLLILGISICSNVFAQVNITLGEGIATNTTTTTPTPYGTFYKNFRQQYLVLASELNNIGGGAGNINSIAFNVDNLNTCSPMPNYRIRIKTTTQTVLTTAFEDGTYTQVFQAASYTPVTGWNTHAFSSPFNWDGSSNLLVDIVTDMITTSYSQNASVFHTVGTFSNSLRYQSDSLPAIDGTPGTLSPNRANIRFNMEALNITDLNALSITGPSTPNVNSAANYTVSIKNYSNVALSNYTVKLMKAGGVQIASLPGTSINSQQTLQFILPWTPTVVGETQLYGKVVMTGDQNPANDETPLLTVTVMAAGLQVVEIGTGTTVNTNTGSPTPYGTWYKSFRQQYLYKAADFVAVGASSGMISALAFNVQDLDTCLPMTNYTIRIKTTTQDALTATFEVGDYTTVWQSDSFMPATAWNLHNFIVPFLWDGVSNLLIDISTDLIPGSITHNAMVYYTPTSYNSSLRAQSDSTPSGATLTGTTALNRSNIRFFMSPPNPNPQFAVNPPTKDFGDVILGYSPSQNFNIMNVGAGTLTVNSISISGGSQFSLNGLPTLPAQLVMGIPASFNVVYAPTTAGNHTATVTITDNRRLTHTIALSGHGVDTTIYTLSHAQNFDEVTVPALPLGWNSIYQATSTTGYVKTSTSLPQSAPNCVTIYNPTDINTIAMLIAPPLANTIPTSSIRVKLWGKGTGYSLKVGVMTDPTDAATFTEIETLTFTLAWAQYQVSLANYTGTGKFIAFKHANNSSGQTIYLDTIELEMMGANDLAATSITGNATPSAGTLSPYTVAVFNNGTAAQSTYSVKLYNSNNVELATAAGTTIAAGTTANITLNWTPTTEGPTSIYGKVILAGDINPGNDATSPMLVSVQPAGVMTVTVGEGNLNEGVPWEFFYKHSLFQTLYYQDELGMFGNITAISFYNNFTNSLVDKPLKLWLGSTTLPDLSAGWADPTALTLVFDGTLSFPSGANTITVPLQVPFNYAGGNLVLYAMRPMDTGYHSSTDDFKAQTIGTNRARKLTNDSTTYDPMAPSATGTLSGTFPKTTFIMAPLSPNPLFIVSPAAKNFGDVVLGYVPSQRFSVINAGGGTLGVSNISISGSPQFSLTGLPTLPLQLTTGQNATFNVVYTPTTAGAHTATVTITDNRRLTHTIALSGNGVDTTINQLSYTQGFDTVTIPNLPLGWNSIYQSTSSSGYVRTVTTSPQSAPNCVTFYNPADINTIAMLVAPPLASTIPVNNVRVKFWGKGTGYSLKVGVMTNPSDANTFTEVSTLTFNAAWEQFQVSLASYTGTGRFIAFKHANNASGQTIYMDTVEFEMMGANDLAATSITGSGTPSVDISSPYTVSVFNNGTAAQSTYNVKLFNSNNVELATATGPTIAPGTSIDVVLNWTPTAQGPMSIYGKVILTGDINPGNDATNPMPVSVQPAGVISITIGDGSQTARMPLDFYYKSSIYQNIYYPAEIGMIGTITTITIYNQFQTTTLQNKPIKIWMGITDQQDLNSNWVQSTAMTQVFDGTMTFPGAANTITFPLQNPFPYTGGNLVVMFKRPLDTAYYSSSDYFKTQTGVTGRAREMHNDSTDYDTANLIGGLVTGIFPKTTLTMTPMTGDPVFMVNPTTHSFGDVNVGGSRHQNFSIVNAGGGTLGINSISIAGSPTMTISTLPTLPAALSTGQAAVFTVNYAPTSEGLNTATVTITDNLGTRYVIGDNSNLRSTENRLAHTIPITGTGVNDITIGAGNLTGRIPLDFFYKSSLFETIYTADEMSNFVGQITGIKFYTQFVTNLTATPIKLWLGSTTQTALTDGWIPSTQMTQVFDGTMDFPSGENVITITFPQPYMHLDGGNLVMMVNRPLDGQYYSSSDYFKTQTLGSNRAREMHNDSTDYDPTAPTGGTVSGNFPKTTFVVIPGGVGDILGTVTGPGNVPIAGATVQLLNETYTTTTNAAGQYSMINVLPNSYTISISKYGYVTHTQAIVLAEDQELTVNATLQPMATVNVSGTILASDTGLGINGGAIHLVGYANYTANSIATGAFTVPAVYANQSYTYSITAPGYSTATGSINVGTTNHVMGSITLTEIAFAPGTVTAALNTPQTEAIVSWLAPDPNSTEVTEGFEAATFPPLEWTQSITNTGVANTAGVFPTWCKFGTVPVAAETVAPTQGTSQGGLWWSYEHQDEWLITPGFVVPPSAYLTFDSYVFLGSTSGDHYYVKGSVDGGSTWTVLWDASAQTGGWNYYASPISVDLAAYSGQQLKLAWHAVDPPSNDGMWYVWFIDDIYIGNNTRHISFSAGDLTSRGTRSQGWQTSASNTHPSRAVENGMHLRESVLPQATQATGSTRSLVGYKVWRLASGQEANQDSWTLLTPENVSTISYTDPGWASLANGNYRWAVKAIYTSNVTSLASFSNILLKEVVTGMISGVVRQSNNQPIPGALVTAGTFTATANNSGAYVLIVPTGTYTVTAAKINYATGTVSDVIVNANQTTTVNFVLIPGSGTDDEVIPATITALLGNYPNPFNPSTTISYSIKDPSPVKLVIYNMKGQKVKTLVDQNQSNGRYNAVWNGKDDNNKAVGSGVYYYRMTAGKYISTRKMLLVE